MTMEVCDNEAASVNGGGVLINFWLEDGDALFAVRLPAGATEGEHLISLVDGYDVSLVMYSGILDAFLGLYTPESGTITLIDYVEAEGKLIEVQVDATLYNGSRWVDLSGEFTVIFSS